MKTSTISIPLCCRFVLGNLIGQYPKLYFPLATRTHSYFNTHLVDSKTELLIAGYPRSANTFMEIAVTVAQSNAIDVASHFHVAAQVHRASELGIPIIVLVRAPQDAVASAYLRDPRIPLRLRIWAYSLYYETITPLRDRFVVASFERATRDLCGVIAEVNERFQTDFEMCETTDAFVEDIYSRIDQRSSQQGTLDEMKVPRPSKSRAEKKRCVIAKMQEARFSRSLARARRVYEDLLSDGKTRSSSQ